jgi:RNA polymerase sigma-70 factor (ECF subfamily)
MFPVLDLSHTCFPLRDGGEWIAGGDAEDTPGLEDADALERVPAPVATQPESLLGAEALAGAIATALEALPLLQREVFLLRAETDLTLDEIAQVIGTSRETAKSRLRYALNRLRAALEPWT